MAVDGAGAEPGESIQVHLCRVALVPGKAVAGKAGIGGNHQPVTGDFGDNGSGSDGQATCVPFDDGVHIT